MNRRAIPVGLLAVALIVLAVVLVSSGGGGQEIEITKGEPFRAGPPVTRDLAYVAEQQRRLDRHPELERLARPPESLGAGGEEESAGETEGEPSEDVPTTAVAGDAPVDTDLKEKPRPGGATSQPSQSGRAA